MGVGIRRRSPRLPPAARDLAQCPRSGRTRRTTLRAQRLRQRLLYDDYLDATGIDLSADRLTPVETRNESLDAETVEFLRILNLHHVENEQAEPGYIDNTAVVEQLRQHQAGPMLTLPEEALDREMERWERSNRATARDFFHDDEGVLFREPRRSGHITTEQRLDPVRLDQLADLVGLTPDVRGPLRAIAEREAAGGRTHA